VGRPAHEPGTSNQFSNFQLYKLSALQTFNSTNQLSFIYRNYSFKILSIVEFLLPFNIENANQVKIMSDGAIDGLMSTLPLEQVKVMLESFHALTGFGCRLVDAAQNELFSIGKQSICKGFYGRSQSNGLCDACGIVKEWAGIGNNCQIYSCMYGLHELECPMEIDGNMMANLFFGPFFIEGKVPLEKDFLGHTGISGLSVPELENMFRTLPRSNAQALSHVKNFYTQLTGIIAFIVASGQKVLNHEKQRIEGDFQENQQKFETIFNNALVGMVITDPAGHYIICNNQWSNMTGYSIEELRQMTYKEVTHPEDRHASESWHNKLLDGQIDDCRFEKRYQRKDGSFFWGMVSVSALRGQKGELKSAISIIFDISERRKAKNALKDSEERFRTLITNLKAFIFMIDEEGVFILADGKGKEEMKMVSENMVGRHVKDVFTGNPEIWRNTRFAMTGKNVRYIHEINNQFFDIQYTPLHGSGRSHHKVIGIAIDITRQKMIEDELNRAKLEAERANQAKSVFLANMSHEIRTPLNAIIGFAELMNNRVENPEFKDYIDTIKTSGRTLLSLINDILDFSKIEAGKMKLTPSSVSIHSVFKELEQVFALKIKNKNLALSFEIAPSVPPSIFFDDLKMQQILINLINNAVKFTEKGFIAVKAHADNAPYITQKRDITDIVVTVSDTGIGIDKSSQTMIFEAFRQSSEHDNRKFEGTGLGLTITKQLIDLMNGIIELKSEPGKGSTFIITFKEVQVIKDERPAVTVRKPIKNHKIQFERTTVLVVDDVETNRILLSEHLRQCNLNVLEAIDGSEALTIARAQLPALVLMDLRMPVLDGIKATEILKNDPATQHIPIIAVTATTIEIEQNLDSKTSFNGFLRKPVLLSTLIGMISKFLKIKDKQEITADDDEEDFFKGITGVKELLLDIKEQLMPEWEIVVESPDFQEVENFAQTVGIVGNKHNFPYFVEYSQKLAQKCRSFNIASMRSMLKAFPDQVKNIENHVK
jgi:PAS domain S-box-containing protein